MINTILFDYDGVLTPDKTGSITICRYISNKINIDFDTLLFEYRKFNSDLLNGKSTHSKIWNTLCNNLNYQIDISLLYESFKNTPINKKVFELIKVLKLKYKTGLITDNKKDRLDVIIKKQNLDELFDVISISSEIGSGKQQKEIFIKTIEKINVNPGNCIFIDNNIKNLEIPKKLGFSTIYYDDNINDVNLLMDELRLNGVSF